tara:strand:+ start:3444 stop:3620 length:177 start_codon:yes stop_codon:yes gene_type:complete
MKRIESIINSQKSAIMIFLILNFIQLRELGYIRIKIDETVHQLTLIELEMERHRGFQK